MMVVIAGVTTTILIVTKTSTSMRKHQRTITHKTRKTASESKEM